MDIKSTRSFSSNRKAMIASTRKKKGRREDNYEDDFIHASPPNKDGRHKQFNTINICKRANLAMNWQNVGYEATSLWTFPLHLTRHDPGGHRGRYWRFPLTDPCQEGEEQAVPSHGEDDPRQREHGAQQAGSKSGVADVVERGGRRSERKLA